MGEAGIMSGQPNPTGAGIKTASKPSIVKKPQSSSVVKDVAARTGAKQMALHKAGYTQGKYPASKWNPYQESEEKEDKE